MGVPSNAAEAVARIARKRPVERSYTHRIGDIVRSVACGSGPAFIGEIVSMMSGNYFYQVRRGDGTFCYRHREDLEHVYRPARDQIMTGG